MTNQPGGWVVETIHEERYFAGKALMPQDRLGSAAHAWLLPYGQELTNGQNPQEPNERVKFATYTRDDWGYDYADQRYYAGSTGRFLTPDPYMASGGARRPSSWNRYAYVVGDPVNLFDPKGWDYELPDVTKFNPSDPGNVTPGDTSVTVTATAPQVDTSSAEYQQQDYWRYYYDGTYQGASPYAQQPDPQTVTSVADRQREIERDVEVYTRVVGALAQGMERVSGGVQALATATVGFVTGGSVLGIVGVVSGPVVVPSLTAGATPVIGTLPFTSQYAGQPGYTVMSIPEAFYTWSENMAWLERNVASGQAFRVSQTGATTTQEINILLDRGYTAIGNFLVPPLR